MSSAVLDTNVLASGTLSASTTPGLILNAWRNKEFELLVSRHILDELHVTFRKEYFRRYLTADRTSSFFELLKSEAKIIPITEKVQGIATHPEDDNILATALSAKADYLVSRDHAFRDRIGNSYRSLSIATPLEFLQVLKR